MDNFWKKEILPLRKTDAVVLLVSHAGIISVLRKYLMSMNYRIHESLKEREEQKNDFWEVRNCSITEVLLGDKGPGEFIRMGDWDHILDALTHAKDRLANSTG
jgi:broad specificity phosphatase PhoE